MKKKSKGIMSVRKEQVSCWRKMKGVWRVNLENEDKDGLSEGPSYAEDSVP